MPFLRLLHRLSASLRAAGAFARAWRRRPDSATHGQKCFPRDSGIRASDADGISILAVPASWDFPGFRRRTPPAMTAGSARLAAGHARQHVGHERMRRHGGRRVIKFEGGGCPRKADAQAFDADAIGISPVYPCRRFCTGGDRKGGVSAVSAVSETPLRRAGALAKLRAKFCERPGTNNETARADLPRIPASPACGHSRATARRARTDAPPRR
jgi:hypothetical protein